ncbi:hypothetical protein BJ165DRAFT_1467335, partial [Panaeolus papilionaceus]
MSNPRVPPELFPLIFMHIEQDTDNFRVASASRLFNRLALRSYFLRHHEDPNPSTIRIYNTFLQPTHLQALLLSLDLVGKNVESLIYEYDSHEDWKVLVQQVRMLTRLINYLGTIKHLRLKLMAARITAHGLGEANLTLLHTAKLKGIQNLDIVSHYSIYYKSLIRRKRGCHVLTYGEGLPVLWPGSNRLKPGTRRQDLHWTEGTPSEPKLKHLVLQSFPSTFRWFYIDVLHFNRHTLTRLEFRCIHRRNKVDFATFLASLDLPALVDFCIEDSEHRHQKAILKFVARHPGITRLRCILEEDGWSSKYPVYPISLLSLQPKYENVEELAINMRYILHFLSPQSSMPSLTKITLHTSLKTIVKGLTVLDEAMLALQYCQTPIQLILRSDCFACDLEEWFGSLLLDDIDTRPERALTCVRSVTLVHDYQSFSAELLSHLPTWFALFPVLEQVQIWAHAEGPSHYYTADEDKVWPFDQPERMIGELKRLCGSIEKFTMVVGMDKAGEVWDVKGLPKCVQRRSACDV